ncbi:MULTISPECIES: hypothetical protein [Streptomycetaceae]|uniref:hypothetical protein n=1 Tax=Embleya scabrispora TaxID=159449 RepID=UPI001319D28A|nr:hypothetical protein [Streptomyces sp. SID5474]
MSDAQRRTPAAAQIFANSPGIPTALDSTDPTAVLQPRVEVARTVAKVDDLVVYGRNGIVLAHSDPRQIGNRFIDTYQEAVAGRAFTRTFEGPRGPSVASAITVKDADGSVVVVAAASAARRCSAAASPRDEAADARRSRSAQTHHRRPARPARQGPLPRPRHRPLHVDASFVGGGAARVVVSGWGVRGVPGRSGRR